MLAELHDFSQLASHMLADEPASVPMEVGRLTRSVLCWSGIDGLSEEEARDVAVAVAPGSTERAWADRYGGSGMGGNGGSGRAGLYRGVYLKGIGPTPLIGLTTDRHHVSGGTYLEEAVRETIFAELFAAELPWGAVRTRAIIDTLEDRHWSPGPEVEFPLERERRVLLVREPPLRLAHLERADYFTGEEHLTGACDILRVAHNSSALVRHLGGRGIEQGLRAFWNRWFEQCGYLYVARLTQGPPATSNVALDGRLLDFGGASSLPDWGTTVVFPGELENNNHFPEVAHYLRRFYCEHSDGVFTNGEPSSDYASALIADGSVRYFRTIGVEMLRLAGLRRVTIESVISKPRACARLVRAVEIALNRYLRSFRNSVDAAFASGLWDFSKLWGERTPVHLRPLRTIADEVAAFARNEPIQERMRTRTRPRERMFNERFRRSLHAALPKTSSGKPIDRAAVSDLIRREVTNARRDSAFEPPADCLCGFAAAGPASYALFREPTGEVYAVAEVPRRSAPSAPKTKQGPRLAFKDGTIGGRVMDVVQLL
jgi:hypothetical protein